MIYILKSCQAKWKYKTSWEGPPMTTGVNIQKLKSLSKILHTGNIVESAKEDPVHLFLLHLVRQLLQFFSDGRACSGKEQYVNPPGGWRKGWVVQGPSSDGGPVLLSSLSIILQLSHRSLPLPCPPPRLLCAHGAGRTKQAITRGHFQRGRIVANGREGANDSPSMFSVKNEGHNKSNGDGPLPS